MAAGSSASAPPPLGGAKPGATPLRWRPCRAAVGIVLNAIALVLFILAMLDFPLLLIKKAVLPTLVIANTPTGIAGLATPAPQSATWYVWNYTSFGPDATTIQQIPYQVTMNQYRYNISFRDGDTLVRYWTRNVYHVAPGSAAQFANDVIVQPSFLHFTMLSMQRTQLIPVALSHIANGTAGYPPLSTLTTQLNIDASKHSAFLSTFQDHDLLLSYIRGEARTDATYQGASYTGAGVSSDNHVAVMSFLNECARIAMGSPPGSSTVTTTPASLFHLFFANQTSEAAAYKENQYTEKFTGADSILNLNRYNLYEGSPVVTDHQWASPEVIQGARDFAADPFRPKTNLRLRVFDATISRVDTWVYTTPTTLAALPLNRYKRDPSTYANALANPGNAKYLMYGPRGIFNGNPQETGAPVHLSMPHFLDGDASLSSGLAGLAPVADLHESRVDIEPNTGLAFRGSVRFQVNVKVEAGQAAGSTLVRGAAPAAYLPLWWIDFSNAASDAVANQVAAQLVSAVNACTSLRLIESVLALFLVMIGTTMFKNHYQTLLAPGSSKK
ncbi:CD36 family [Plasmodiophora brassicae]